MIFIILFNKLKNRDLAVAVNKTGMNLANGGFAQRPGYPYPLRIVGRKTRWLAPFLKLARRVAMLGSNHQNTVLRSPYRYTLGYPHEHKVDSCFWVHNPGPVVAKCKHSI